jgi:hypothetical protein
MKAYFEKIIKESKSKEISANEMYKRNKRRM